MCEHLRFEAHVEVARVLPSEPGADMRFLAHVQVRCVDCRTRFAFQGVPWGLGWDAPHAGPPGFELRAPIVPDAHATSMLGGDPDTAFPAARAQEGR